MKIRFLSVVVAGSLMLAAGCQTTGTETKLAEAVAAASEAQDPAEATIAEAETVAVSDPNYDPDRIVCKTRTITGSRLNKQRDCRTAEEWRDAMSNATRSVNNWRDDYTEWSSE